MFCDVGYISYFNSFFTEPASYIFLLIPAFLLASAVWMLLASKQNRLFAECYCVLALMALASFFTAVLGDTWDVVKHFFLYNLLTDICITMFFAGLASRLKTPESVKFAKQQ